MRSLIRAARRSLAAAGECLFGAAAEELEEGTRFLERLNDPFRQPAATGDGIGNCLKS